MAICICMFDIFGKQLPRIDGMCDEVFALFTYSTNTANTNTRY